MTLNLRDAKLHNLGTRASYAGGFLANKLHFSRSAIE